MSLIKCIDCGEMISDRSECCIKCGCPTSESIKEIKENKFFVKINDRFYDLSEYNDVNDDNKVKYYGKLRRQAEIDLKSSMNIINDIRNNSLKSEYTCEYNPYTPVAPNQLRCPKCGSTSITTGQKGYSLLTGFLGSNKTVNRCGNCGYKWTPGK